MNKLNIFVGVLLISLLASGCADRKNLSPFPTISDNAKADLSAPVDCQTAQKNISVLESEKASVGRQVLSGVRSIMPISAVAGILMGDYSDRVEVASGEYNNDIEAKIAIIKSSCGLS